jgi:sugar phosphate isomerase/epimerase
MEAMKIYAFADEASPMVDGQIAAMRRNGLNGLEIRGVDGENISSISVVKAREVRAKMDGEGLAVWSIGSPIGKIDIEKDDFARHLDQLRHTLTIADVLGAKNLRMFSFFIPTGKRPDDFRQAVMDRLGEMLRVAQGSGVALCHENEKGIYGDNACRCEEILRVFPALKGVFDPANFVQCGQDTWEAWERLRPYTKYLHIKDALWDGSMVPAGCGVGQVKRILNDYRAKGGRVATIEPHLKVFSGLAELERAGEKSNIGLYSYASSDDAFDAACAALKSLM